MIHLAPFESLAEHQNYCRMANVPFEDGAVGFKIFSDEEEKALCQLKFVGSAAYVLNLCAIQEKISVETLANVFVSVVEFLRRVEVDSIVYPIQSKNDVTIAEALGFDRITESMYVFDFVSDEPCENEGCSCHDHKHNHER